VGVTDEGGQLMTRIIGATAISLLMVFSFVSTSYSQLYRGVAYFTDGESVEAETIEAMNSKEYLARFITFGGNQLLFDEIEVIEFPGETDFRGSYKFIVTKRDGEKVSGWINYLDDFGYMWQLTFPEHDRVYKINKGVRAEDKKEIEKITLEEID
jgi:hypothetical protein